MANQRLLGSALLLAGLRLERVVAVVGIPAGLDSVPRLLRRETEESEEDDDYHIRDVPNEGLQAPKQSCRGLFRDSGYGDAPSCDEGWEIADGEWCSPLCGAGEIAYINLTDLGRTTYCDWDVTAGFWGRKLCCINGAFYPPVGNFGCIKDQFRNMDIDRNGIVNRAEFQRHTLAARGSSKQAEAHMLSVLYLDNSPGNSDSVSSLLTNYSCWIISSYVVLSTILLVVAFKYILFVAIKANKQAISGDDDLEPKVGAIVEEREAEEEPASGDDDTNDSDAEPGSEREFNLLSESARSIKRMFAQVEGVEVRGDVGGDEARHGLGGEADGVYGTADAGASGGATSQTEADTSAAKKTGAEQSAAAATQAAAADKAAAEKAAAAKKAVADRAAAEKAAAEKAALDKAAAEKAAAAKAAAEKAAAEKVAAQKGSAKKAAAGKAAAGKAAAESAAAAKKSAAGNAAAGKAAAEKAIAAAASTAPPVPHGAIQYVDADDVDETEDDYWRISGPAGQRQRRVDEADDDGALLDFVATAAPQEEDGAAAAEADEAFDLA